ncbi:MAG: hypothetical protein JOZ78_21885 [Chroococcidiopsidaceae cyanobacterium CP_BM_ER_R8_30]|nr:hypothetical protein [Chroococcidiopsidaceae cyanobacterium CP_BM_ER_R8_30]
MEARLQGWNDRDWRRVTDFMIKQWQIPYSSPPMAIGAQMFTIPVSWLIEFSRFMLIVSGTQFDLIWVPDKQLWL